MDKLIESAPNIIGQAAKSPLGIFALMILALSVLGFFFFRNSSERTRTAIFVLMLVGVASFGYATFRTASGNQSVRTANPQPAQGTIVNPGTSENSSFRPSLETPTSFSNDKDHPTRLRANEVRGKGIDRKRVRYYFSFLGGPGEVKVTFDFTSGGLAQGAYATIFDQDFVKIEGITIILNRGENERKIVRFPVSQQQIVIVELDLEGNEVSTAGSFLLRVEGAVQFL